MTDAEIIREIAEKLMGWKLKYPYYYTNGNWWLDKNNNPVFAVSEYETGEYEFRVVHNEFDPLTNANHRDMVVERMRELGWTVSMSCSLDYWEVNMTLPVGRFLISDDKEIYFQHSNLGHAVCLAVLQMLEEA